MLLLPSVGAQQAGDICEKPVGNISMTGNLGLLAGQCEAARNRGLRRSQWLPSGVTQHGSTGQRSEYPRCGPFPEPVYLSESQWVMLNSF